MKLFDENFRSNLYETIGKLESESQIEAVVIIKSKSGDYTPWAFVGATIVAFLLFSILMIIPIDMSTYFMFGISIALFVGAYFLLTKNDNLLSKVIPAKIKSKNAEIYARAIFQKGHIYNTGEHTGVLFYCSVLEKQTVIIPDWGITLSVPEEEMKTIKNRFDKVFSSANPADDIISALNFASPIFAESMPHRDDDINEIPDDLDVDL